MTPPHLSDAELARRCSLKPPDEDAWHQIYDRYHRLINWQVSRSLPGEPDHVVDDLAAEIVAKLYRQIGRYDPARGSLGSFIATLARHHAIDFQRRTFAEKEHTAQLEPDSLASISPPQNILGGVDLETATTRHVVASIYRDQQKLRVFYELSSGKNAYQIATEHGWSQRYVYRTKEELMDLVKQFLASFLSGIHK